MPKLNISEQVYYEAFLELGSDRSAGMSLGAIPRRSIKDYAEELGLTERETEAFLYVIRYTDLHYLKVQADKAAKRAKS